MLHHTKYLIATLTICLTQSSLFSMSVKEVTKTDLEQKLELGEKKEFITVLMENSCTRTASSNILNSSIRHNKFEFFKIIIGSKKLCPDYCCHKKSFFFSKKPKPHNSLQAMIDRELKIHTQADEYIQCISRKIQQEKYNENNYTLLMKPEFITLAILTADSHELLRERFNVMLKSKAPLNNLHCFARWICDFCVMANNTKDHLSYIFICPACTDNFKTMITKEQVSLNDLTKLSQTDFEYALVTRSTENFITLLHTLLKKPGHLSSQTILATLEAALKAHTKIWPPYANEIEKITTTLKNMYAQHYCMILSQKKMYDSYFNFA